MHVGGIFCDLAKPFDCVNNKSLLKLEYSFFWRGAFKEQQQVGSDPI
jgi:hypothetical protein